MMVKSAVEPSNHFWQHLQSQSHLIFILPLQELNQYLEDKVYLAGNIFTLADILMYYGIHHIVVSPSAVNFSRLREVMQSSN